MSDVVEKIDGEKGYSVDIVFDVDRVSPRMDCNLGTMVCTHKKRNLGDEQFNSGEEIEEIIAEVRKEESVVLPLFLYDHSGITISTTPFSCAWDSGQVGYIYCTEQDIRNEYNLDDDCDIESPAFQEALLEATKRLESEVEKYDQHLTGDVYGFIVKDPDGEIKQSYSGYYGFDHVKEEAEFRLSKAVSGHVEPVFVSSRP